MVLGLGSYHGAEPGGRRGGGQSSTHGADVDRVGEKARPPQYMIVDKAFPRLTEYNHRTTSPPSADYNCIAWSAEDIEHWWQPGVYWPSATPRHDYGIGILEQAFLALGFEDCGMDGE